MTLGIRSNIDTGRLIAMVRRPGIDPRMHVAIGEVTDVGYDADHGMFADVRLQPDMHEECCLVGSDFVDDGAGEWNPLKPGDIVLIALPMGNPGYGPVLFSRIFSASAKPPPEFHDENSDDPTEPSPHRTLVIRGNIKYRVVAKEGAQISMEVSGYGSFDVKATGNAPVNMSSETSVNVNAPTIVFGEGGAGVARVGDIVVGAISAADIAAAIATPNPTGAIKFVAQIFSGSSVTESS